MNVYDTSGRQLIATTEVIIDTDIGVAQIAGSNTSVNVTVDGMATTGLAAVWLEASSGGPTIPWPTYGTNTLTLNVAIAPEQVPADGLVFNIGWRVLRKS